MGVFDRVEGFERVVFAADPAAGLRAIVAIHSTRIGPALGGCRIKPYPNEEDALTDVLRLARAMTWKASAAGLDLGGGKAVIIADPEREKTEALLRAFGRVVDSLHGRYITSLDIGTNTPDLDEICRETRWVTGVSPFNGGGGDPSPITARGVYSAIRSCLYHLDRNPEIRGKKIAIQGVGKVGFHLARLLVSEGAEVVAGDPNVDNLGRAVSELGVVTCDPERMYEIDCDVFSPCALGGCLNEKTIPQLHSRIVCGAANTQLATDEDADRLADAGILYAPDFIVNAGGLISAADELHGWDHDRVIARTDRIGRTLLDVFHLAASTGRNPAQAAVDYAKARIERLDGLIR